MRKSPCALPTFQLVFGLMLALWATWTPSCASAQSPNTAEATNRVAAYTAWDEEFLYLLLQVNKPVISGKNSAPFSNPLQDDTVVISLQTDNDRKATQRTANTYVIAVSGVGGVQLYRGANGMPLYNGLEEDFNKRLQNIIANEKDPDTQQKKTTELLATLIRVALNQRGAKRTADVVSPGYTVEVAIPWINLGGKPQSDAKMGFHLAALSITNTSPAVQALSPLIKVASDLYNPSLWQEIVFRNAPEASQEGVFFSPRVVSNKPNIDGELSSGEWNGLSYIEFGERINSDTAGGSLIVTLASRTRPEYKPLPMRPTVSLPEIGGEPLPLPPRQPQAVPPLLFANYLFDFQGDPRKATPVRKVNQPNGATALALHPLEGVGAWMTFERVDWHAKQLVEARRAGVDVILPFYRGDTRSRQLYGIKGLTLLGAALESLKRQEQDYPQVGLYLDTTALTEHFGDRPDLRDRTVQSVLYGMIRDFYRQIPVVFRCAIPLAQGIAHPVFLSSATAFKEWDSSFVSYLRGRFAAEFDGADLLILGAADFKSKATLDGYFTESKDKGFQFEDAGWIKIGSVGAGYDNSVTRSPAEPLRLRSIKEGASYRQDWASLLAKKPQWILLDGWNDYANGASVAPTTEYGYTLSDITRISARFFAGTNRLALKFLGSDTPRSLPSNTSLTLHARVQNLGVEGWAANGALGAVPLSFAYRWTRKGEVIATGESKPLAKPVFPLENATLSLNVQTRDSNKSPLPDGEYVLEIGGMLADKNGRNLAWVGDNATTPALRIPVTIGATAPKWAATLLYSDMSRSLETGGAYDVNITLRNDGNETWRIKDNVRIGLRLFRIEPVDNLRGLKETLVPTSDASATLPQDVLPGQEVTVRIPFALVTPSGEPLPIWTSEQVWNYVARYEIGSEKTAAPVSNATTPTLEAVGVLLAPVSVMVTDFDFGVRFLSDETLPQMLAERRLPMRLSLQNMGTQTWKAELVRIGYHWRYLDGTELTWDAETTPLTKDLPPGGVLDDFLGWVTAPPYDGVYWLEWDVKFGETWASTQAGSRPLDTSGRLVKVIRGRLSFPDLTKHFNLDGISDASNPKDGDFDGVGHTFPADLVPPFSEQGIVPIQSWLPVSKTGIDSPRRISFRWAPKQEKAKNFIVCNGQRINLGESAAECRVLHILAASTNVDVATTFGLIFAEPLGESEDQYAITVSRWDRPPQRNDEIALFTRRVHGANGVESGTVALYHYTIKVREPRKLIGLNLPNAPNIKIAAITLEK